MDQVIFYVIICVYANALSNILGMILAKTGDDNSRHGLVLTYINHGLNYVSIITSIPNI